MTPFVTLRLTVEGQIDPRSGYLCNIRDLDQVVRLEAIPILRQAYSGGDHSTPARLLISELWRRLANRTPTRVRLADLEWRLTPYLRYTIHKEDANMVHLTQAFEFSASHRLYNSSLSEAENQALFGKCANKNGHGHNYVVDVTVAEPALASQTHALSLARFEEVVKSKVIDRFDHKHLNLDCPEFAALNPTVENITQVIWNLLVHEVGPVKLSCIRVWETPKTYAEYRG